MGCNTLTNINNDNTTATSAKENQSPTHLDKVTKQINYISIHHFY